MKTTFPITTALSKPTIAEENIQIDGMKVIFHETVGLIPTELVSPTGRKTKSSAPSNMFSIHSKAASLPAYEFLEFTLHQEGITLNDLIDAHWSGLTEDERIELTALILTKNPSLQNPLSTIEQGTTIDFPYKAIEVHVDDTPYNKTYGFLTVDEFKVFAAEYLDKIYKAQDEALDAFNDIFTHQSFSEKQEYSVSGSVNGVIGIIEGIVKMHMPVPAKIGYDFAKILVKAFIPLIELKKKNINNSAKDIFLFIQNQRNILNELNQASSDMVKSMAADYQNELRLLKDEELMKQYGKKMYRYVHEVYPEERPPISNSSYYVQKLIEDYMTNIKPKSAIVVRLHYKPDRGNSITYMEKAYVSGTEVNDKLAAAINNCFVGERTTVKGKKYRNSDCIPLLRFKVNKKFIHVSEFPSPSFSRTLHLAPNNLIIESDGLSTMQYLRGTKDSKLVQTTLYGENEIEHGINEAYQDKYYSAKTKLVYPKKLEE